MSVSCYHLLKIALLGGVVESPLGKHSCSKTARDRWHLICMDFVSPSKKGQKLHFSALSHSKDYFSHVRVRL